VGHCFSDHCFSVDDFQRIDTTDLQPQEDRMKVVLGFLLPLLSFGTAVAADIAPASSLMLSAIVAEHSPVLGRLDRRTVAALAAGVFAPGTSNREAIVVAADDLECRVSNVDITSRSCTIRFGRRTVTLKGRNAHELFATLAEMGVTPSGAAGTVYLGASHLNCTINPNELREKGGGGANCTFGPGTE
jgi:hypothetical protein